MDAVWSDEQINAWRKQVAPWNKNFFHTIDEFLHRKIIARIIVGVIVASLAIFLVCHFSNMAPLVAENVPFYIGLGTLFSYSLLAKLARKHKNEPPKWCEEALIDILEESGLVFAEEHPLRASVNQWRNKNSEVEFVLEWLKRSRGGKTFPELCIVWMLPNPFKSKERSAVLVLWGQVQVQVAVPPVL